MAVLYFPLSTLANPVEASQMQYSGSASDDAVEVISKTAVTIITVSENAADTQPEVAPTETEDDDDDNNYWPTSSVIGMNLEQLLSYEFDDHNFGLRPSTQASKPSLTHGLPSATPKSDVSHHYAGGLSQEEEEAHALSIINAVAAPIRAAAASIGNDVPDNNDPSASPLPTPAASLDRRLIWIPNMAGCDDKDYPGQPQWKRSIKLLLPPNPLAPRAEHHAYRARLYDLAKTAAPYMPQNRATKTTSAASTGSRRKSSGAPYGAVLSHPGYALYTDMSAYEKALSTWASDNALNSCWSSQPQFVVTTVKKQVSKAPIIGSKTYKGNVIPKKGQPKGDGVTI
ncbi:uncharacterized protein AB675_576 [Cyphellophora attinorum]|uniref:Uncharacterized protein n=1 Tax=Cyphellophora attinorum TaxID=1664694 RepID=A0A0N1HXS5_9EURO|nr:uncharacterized protein AB675_576 [Phialophora attinorum]KPI45443.1 hypothetical protein AB675_576 [Phialophora attinorum]